mgnify:CR=1 FL=1
MIDLEFIQQLMKVFDESGVDSLELDRGGTRVRLAKTPPSASNPDINIPSPAEPPRKVGLGAVPTEVDLSESFQGDLLEITAPMVGTFYHAPAPDAQPYVKVGSRVSPGDTVCIIEAMKLMNGLVSEISGTITEICVENAQPVEFGQVMFRIDPT